MLKKSKLTLIPILFAGILSIEACAAIVPKDGTWEPQMVPIDAQGCSAMFQGVLAKSQTQPQTKKFLFSKPFHPNDIFEPEDIGMKLEWTNPKPNYWRAKGVNTDDDKNLNSVLELQITSQTTIDFSSELIFEIPKELAAILGSGCTIKSSGTLKRISQ